MNTYGKILVGHGARSCLDQLRGGLGGTVLNAGLTAEDFTNESDGQQLITGQWNTLGDDTSVDQRRLHF